jgi:hypothetical protein
MSYYSLKRKKAMKKQLEVGKTYPTRNRLATGLIICDDLSGTYPCGAKLTKNDGEVKLETYMSNGRFNAAREEGYDLIIPEPEPTYRAWVKEEIPVGARVWDKEKVNRIMTIISTEKHLNGTEGFTLPKNMNHGGVFFVSCDDALKRYVFFNGTSWQPCGVLE